MGDGLDPVEVSVSDPGELRSLREHLRRAPGVQVTQAPGAPTDGQLGAWDVLQVAAASGGALAVAMRTLPEFVPSRRSHVTVTVKSGDDMVTVTADNVEDALPVVERMLDARRPRQ